MNNAPPNISVVLPLYNKAEYIGTVLDHALSQSIQDFEIIIVDDGSTDRSAEIVRHRTDSRLRYVFQKNSGVSIARNVGLQQARAELVAFLDADDVWRADHLRHLLELARRFPQAALYANGFVEIETLQAIAPTGPAEPHYRLLPDYLAAVVHGPSPFFTSACMVRRDIALQLGGFPPGHNHGEDLALWVQIALRHPVAISTYIGCQYLRTPGSLTAQPVLEPDICMQILQAALMERPVPSAQQALLMKEYYNKLALAHALHCLRCGQVDAARYFVKLSATTGLFRRRWLQLRLLSLLPAPLVVWLVEGLISLRSGRRS